MGKPFTPERLASIRRMRKARRLHKQIPLFAFQILREEYSGYTHEQFLDDLRYRKPHKRKEKKTTLTRYGRYRRMLELIKLYENTGNPEYGMQAQRLRKRMTKPYIIFVKLQGEVYEYTFPPTIPVQQVEKLTAKLSTCSIVQQADEIVDQFWSSAHIN